MKEKQRLLRQTETDRTTVSGLALQDVLKEDFQVEQKQYEERKNAGGGKEIKVK